MPQILLLSVGTDETLLELRNTILRKSGYTVVSSSSPRKALIEFRAGDFDLVILCHSISEADRQLLCQRMRLRSPGTPILQVREIVCDGESPLPESIPAEPQTLLAKLNDLIATRTPSHRPSSSGPIARRGD